MTTAKRYKGWRRLKTTKKSFSLPFFGRQYTERFCEHCCRHIDGEVCEEETGLPETHYYRCTGTPDGMAKGIEYCETCMELIICPVCGEDGTCEHRS